MKNNKIIIGFAETILRFRWWVMMAALLLVAATGSGIRFLEFSNDYRVFFSKENPELAAFETLQNTYTKNDNVLFVIAPKDGKVFTRETLSSIEWLTKEAWQTPYSSRVDSITNFQYTEANDDDLVVRNLIKDAKSLSDTELERVKRIALEEPLLLNRLISPKAHVTGVSVNIILPGKKLSEGPEVVKKVRELADQLRQRDPNLEIRMTGMVMMNNAFYEYSQKDSQTLVPIMLGVILFITWLTLRSGYGTLATLLVMIFSIVTAMGVAGWLGFRLTPPSASAPTIILTLAIADSVHILSTLFQKMRTGMVLREALVESLRINWQAVFLTSFTTVIGFLSLNFNSVPPFRDLGNIVAIGVAAAWLYSVTFLPAFAAVLPMRVKTREARGGFDMERFGNFVIKHSRPLLWGMSLLTIGLLLLIPRNEMNDQFVNYFDKGVEFRDATDFTVANLSGVYLLGYSLKAGASGGISNPEYLRKVDEFAEWLRQQPKVMHVTSLVETMKRLNKNMHGDDPAYYVVPDNRELAAQYLLLYEMSLPFGLDLNNQINVDKSSSLLRVTLENLSSKEAIAMDEKAHAWLHEHAPPYMLTHAADPTLMFSHIGQRSAYSMISGNVAALVLISVVLIFAFRNLKIGLISLIPNLIPAGMAFGLWGVLVGQVGMASSVITSLTFGIVVDDTIHFLSKYLLARREQGLTAREAVLYAYRTVGAAMVITTVILVAGFSVLTLSSFELNHSMGLLSSITLSFALLADLILLPLLLLKWDGRHDEKMRFIAEPVRAGSAG